MSGSHLTLEYLELSVGDKLDGPKLNDMMLFILETVEMLSFNTVMINACIPFFLLYYEM